LFFSPTKIDYFCKNTIFFMQVDFSKIDPRKHQVQKHNLKMWCCNSRNKLWLQGFPVGKSSLILCAEGQRRYVESLSSYARQFLGRLDKPKVEYIKVLLSNCHWAKVNTTNARSTVGTSTEFMIIWVVICPHRKNLFTNSGQK
jgi:excinuclease ABC subunit A